MTANEKMGWWSVAGLIGSLAIAWYFSKRQSAQRAADAVQASATNADGTPADAGTGDLYTFNIPPLVVPPLSITIPPTGITTPGSPSGASGGCCAPCSANATQSGTAALIAAIQGSTVYNAIAQNTAPTPPPTITASKQPYEPLVLPDPSHPGAAVKNPFLYANDPVYKQAWDQMIAQWNESPAVVDTTYNPPLMKYGQPASAFALQQVQQYLFYFGDNPNANAVNPISIH